MGNCRQINVQGGEILSRTHPRRMLTDPIDEARGHFNPLRHPLEDRHDASGIQRPTQ
jgi:hypothetical protein